MTRDWRVSRLAGVCAALLAGTSTSRAQTDAFPSDFLRGVYSSEPGCASGHQPLRDDNVTYLTAEGLSAIEYTCEFLRYDGVPGARAFIAVTACSAPGELTPELILVRDIHGAEGPASEVEVLYHGETEPTAFHRCPTR